MTIETTNGAHPMPVTTKRFGRGRLAPALATALAAAAALAGAATAHADAAAEVPAPGTGTAIAWTSLANVDGTVWTPLATFDRDSGAQTLRLVRLGAEGRRAEVMIGSVDARRRPGHQLRSALRPLADGTVGGVFSYTEATHTSDVRLIRFDADGRRVRDTPLPQPARRATTFLVEQDGTVWWARSCAGRLYRHAPNGRTSVTRLTPIDCRDEREQEIGTALALGDAGEVWVVNLCQRRIARRSADGRLQQWRPRIGACDVIDADSRVFSEVRPARLAVDPRGGLVYRLSDASGRIGPGGRLRGRSADSDPAFVAADGTLWNLDGTRIAPDGTRTPPPLPDIRHALPARDGGAWLVRSRSHYVDAYKQSFTWYDDLLVRHVAADGSTHDWPLAPPAENVDRQSPARGAIVGGDGALWLEYAVGYAGETRTVQLSPPGLAQPRAPQASATRVVGRQQRSVAVQLGCDADVGRWCSGTLNAAAATAPARFVIAGQQRAAVRLTLSARAARALRGGRAVRTTAIVRSTGAEATRKALSIR